MSVFVNWLKYRTYWDFNTIIVIVGDNRMGKSYAAIRLCEELDPNFNEDKIVFTLNEFLEFVEKAEPCWLLFDEVGVTFSSYEYWSLENRIFGHVSEAFGKLGINLILTLPSISMLSRQGLAMVHFFLDMKRRGLARVYQNWKSAIMGKRGISNMGHIELGLPSPHLIDVYEKKKINFLKTKGDEWKTIYKAHQLKALMKAKKIVFRGQRKKIKFDAESLVKT